MRRLAAPFACLGFDRAMCTACPGANIATIRIQQSEEATPCGSMPKDEEIEKDSFDSCLIPLVLFDTICIKRGEQKGTPEPAKGGTRNEAHCKEDHY